MKEFAYYLYDKSVKKQAIDKNTAKATLRSGIERLELAKRLRATEKPKYVLENSYEALREIIDAVLFLRGYKSYSHEASVAYLFELGFSISDVEKVDRLRRLRNGIKYYGEDAVKEDADSALILAETTSKKILEQIKELKP